MQGHLNILRELYFPDVDRPGPLIRFSRRMTRKGGAYDITTEDMVLALGLVKEHGIDEAIDTVKHELIHWARPEDDSPHGPEFREEADRIGCNLYSPEFAQDRHRTSNKRYVYACPVCRHRTMRKKRGELSCANCNPNEYDERFALVLAEKLIIR